ncbi:MAG TPA: single-stranded DNA-binding protein [Kiritimatiellia bacterium]|nr:single-stranded DNA-binding protein [Kiritimatiellia bacterium]HMO99174.1 single-stranded DNA-binding protein [Kiritimatiellia bacterium]
MSSMNIAILMGNLTRDPEKRTTPTGMAVSDLGLAVSDNYKDKDGKLIERTCFVDVIAWGRQAETCAQYLKKGSPVMVEGKLQLDQWKTDNGEKRSKLRVKATRIQFLGRAADADKPGSVEVMEEENAESVPF